MTTRVTDGFDTKVLVLTTFDLDEYVYAAMWAGASGLSNREIGAYEAGVVRPGTQSFDG